jgi:sigma-B regulation protein RsbU (phosphoserine phosphatase)
MRNLKKIPIPLLITAACIWVAVYLFPRVHPLGGLQFKSPKHDIEIISRQVLEEIGADPSDQGPEISLKRDRKLITELQEGLGIATANGMLRETVPGYYWEVIWAMRSESEDQLENWSKDRVIEIRLNTSGELIYFSRNIPDSTELPAVGLNQAKLQALNFVQRFTSFKNMTAPALVTDTLSERTRVHISEDRQAGENALQRRDYDFTWRTTAQGFVKEIKLNALVKGDQLAHVEVEYITDAAGNSAEQAGYPEIIKVLLYFFLFVVVLILAVRQIRTYELNFGLALKLSLFAALMVIISVIPNSSPMHGWLLIALFLISPLFVGGIFIILWAVSETVGRETWKEKFISLDLLTRGHFLHSRIGQTLLTGLAGGLLTFTLYLGLLWISAKFNLISGIFPDNDMLQYLGYETPFIYLLPHSVWNAMYSITVSAVLVASLVYLKFKWKPLAVLLGTVTFALIVQNNISPAATGFVIHFLVYSLIIFLFVRYDILTSFTAVLVFSLAGPAMAVITDSTVPVVILSLLALYAAAALLIKDRVRDFSSIEPALSRFISERQHMRQQLEVARSVQMSFLPRTNPVFAGLDIDARCIPAYEVGGDYFDFVPVSPEKMAVAIGDVSGKGTKAAFYMTLVKGFLRALTRGNLSPAALLKELNALFYENTSRDAFISLIYSIFDTKEKKVILARSGHSPVMLYQAEEKNVKMIVTEGLAVGLEKGDLYNRMIRESTLGLKPGDVFLFYTDGVTEAMNTNKEEFGEERLQQVLLSSGDQAAGVILKKILTEVRRFSRFSKQHDDMTLIVIKVI